jgi:hypothetical protein
MRIFNGCCCEKHNKILMNHGGRQKHSSLKSG